MPANFGNWKTDNYKFVGKAFDFAYADRLNKLSPIVGEVNAKSIDYELTGSGGYGEMAEYDGSNLNTGSMKRGFKTVITPVEYTLSIPVGYKAAKIDKMGETKKVGSKLGDSAALTVYLHLLRMFANAWNYLAHYQSTALEIWQQTGGNIDYLVCAIGTSGTLMGLSRFLKVMKPDIKVVCAQPIRGHYIQGLKNMEEAIVPDIYDPSQIDVQEMIESEEAISMAREIIRREAIFAGMSSGAAMLAAVRTAQKIERGNIVVVFPDRAEKYLSTTMFDEFSD